MMAEVTPRSGEPLLRFRRGVAIETPGDQERTYLANSDREVHLDAGGGVADNTAARAKQAWRVLRPAGIDGGFIWTALVAQAHRSELATRHSRAPDRPTAKTLLLLQPQISITRKKVQILLTKFRAAVRTNKESENTSQWQREPKQIFLHWRRTRKCGPKKFPTEIDEKTTKTPISVGNFFGPHFRVRRQ